MDPEANTALPPSLPPRVPCVEVAAGLVFRDGRLLIAQRYPDSHLGGLWEFPGGKREGHETFEAALVRELQEELGITVVVGDLVETILHHYPDKSVHLQFYRCAIRSGEPQALGCHAWRWIRPSELSGHEFPAADVRLLARLKCEEQLWSGPAPG